MKKYILFIFFIFYSISSSNAAEITIDISNYDYEEEVNGAFFMSDESGLPFISIGIRDWDTKSNVAGKPPLSFLYTTDLTYGEVDYTGSGTMKKDYYKARFEGYAVYDYKQFSPFIGLGYRRLLDDSGGSVSSTGAFAYDRLSEYFYAPIGTIFNASDKVTIKAQYNLFIAGQQTSYLSDFSGGLNDLENDQNSGWGFDAAIDYKIDDKWSIYAFYRYWDIDDSETGTVTFLGTAISESALEPQNITEEIGIGIAYEF